MQTVASHLGTGLHFNPFVRFGGQVCTASNAALLLMRQTVMESCACKVATIQGGDCVQTFKYGVVSTADAHKDLCSWQHMYLAGRMHKPVEFISDTAVCKCIQRAILSNRAAAVSAAALMLQGKQFTAYQLLCAIVGLSYIGAQLCALRLKFLMHCLAIYLSVTCPSSSVCQDTVR